MKQFLLKAIRSLTIVTDIFPGIHEGMSIKVQQAENLFMRDIASYLYSVFKVLPIVIDSSINLIFAIGDFFDIGIDRYVVRFANV